MKREKIFTTTMLLITILGLGWFGFSKSQFPVQAKGLPAATLSVNKPDKTGTVDQQDYQSMTEMMQQHHGDNWQACANTAQPQQKLQST